MQSKIKNRLPYIFLIIFSVIWQWRLHVFHGDTISTGMIHSFLWYYSKLRSFLELIFAMLIALLLYELYKNVIIAIIIPVFSCALWVAVTKCISDPMLLFGDSFASMNYKNKLLETVVSLIMTAFLAFLIHSRFDRPDTIRDASLTGRVLCLYSVFFILPYLLDAYMLGNPQTFLDFYLFNQQYMTSYLIEGIMMLALFLILFSLIKKTFLSTLISMMLIFILTFCSKIKYSARGELLNINDLKLTEAATMATEYIRFDVDINLIILSAFFLAIAAYAFKLDKDHPASGSVSGAIKSRAPGTFIGIAILIICTLIISVTDQKMMFSKDYSEDYYDHAVLNRFVSGASQYYEYKDVAESVKYFENSKDHFYFNGSTPGTDKKTQYPNIIVIMDESWWNPELSSSGNGDLVIPDIISDSFHELNTDGRHLGNVSVNVYGGGTINSELEFLMGLNTKYFTFSDSLYHNLEGEHISSIVDYFKSLGYYTIAMHPYDGGFYERDAGYKKLGFDRILFEKDFSFTERYYRYISDDALVDQIMKEYRETEGPKFIWAVSIANHKETLDSKYQYNDDYPFPVSPDYADLDISEASGRFLRNTLNGVYLTANAYRRLTDELKKENEDVVAIMYGDHLPSYSGEELKLLGVNENKAHTTPIVEWDNCLTRKPAFTGEGICYISAALTDCIPLPECPMLRVMSVMRSDFKTDTKFEALDGEGREFSEINERLLNDILYFHSLQHAMVSGDEAAKNMWIPVSP